jgi:hypothetical protein
MLNKMIDWIKLRKRIAGRHGLLQGGGRGVARGAGACCSTSAGGNYLAPLGPGRTEAVDAVLQEGMVFTIKPRIPIKGVKALRRSSATLSS